MKCAIHFDRDAIGGCVNCGRFVCPECKTSVGNQVYCNSCVETKLKTGAWPSKNILSGENSSGTGTMAEIPPEIKGWNWGGFLLTWIWGIGNNVWISLLALLGLIPYIGWIANLTMRIILGIKGTEWAWRSKKWESIEHFKKTQRTWMWWGIGMVIFEVIFIALLIFLLAALFVALGASGMDWNWRNKAPWQW